MRERSSGKAHFDQYATDYAFFMAHSTEAIEDCEAILPYLQRKFSSERQLSLLDIGVGNGSFSRELLSQLNIRPEHLYLTLVEPARQSLETAIDALQKLTTNPIVAFNLFNPDVSGAFDVILANHSLYFVEDLEMTLNHLVSSRKHNGLGILTMSGIQNVLIRMWTLGYMALGIALPYFISEDVSDILMKNNVTHKKSEIPYSIEFVDSLENRLKILRFLFPADILERTKKDLVMFFDQYHKNGQISIRSTHDLYIISD